MMKRLLLALALLALAAPAQASEHFITLASTTSTENSGLFAHLLPQFTHATGIEVRVIAVGTGQALRIARNGDADVLLVHHRASEEKFVAEAPAERADLRVVAVTMDPTHDTPEVLAELAGMHGMQAPLYNLVTGDANEVESILDAMGIIRKRDPETGVIDHANLFLLVDREGKIAYRLTLGDLQERWLASALKLLLREPPDVS